MTLVSTYSDGRIKIRVSTYSGCKKKLNVQNSVNSMRNCVHYMYIMSGFAKKLNIQNCINLTGNCVHYMYGMSGFGEK